MRLLVTLAGVAIGFAVPVLAQEQNTVDSEARQNEAALMKYDEKWSKKDTLEPTKVLRSISFGSTTIS
jgi:hypothetical protein